MLIPKILSWNDRFALIDQFKPTTATVLTVFNVTSNEYEVACNLRRTGTFTASKNLDYNSYASAFSSNFSIHKTMTTKPEVQSIIKPNTEQPQTATKKLPAKRGRKGNNIVTAFGKVPSAPINAVTFAKEHKVSIAVLRQSKRFDPQPETGIIKVKKDKNTGNLMIWRAKA
jgi:hypothetical protein